MILSNKTLMCPWGNDSITTVEHTTPIIIMVKLGWSSRGPTINIKLSCPDRHCGWKVDKEISLLKMMERTSLCPTNDNSKTGLKDS